MDNTCPRDPQLTSRGYLPYRPTEVDHTGLGIVLSYSLVLFTIVAFLNWCCCWDRVDTSSNRIAQWEAPNPLPSRPPTQSTLLMMSKTPTPSPVQGRSCHRGPTARLTPNSEAKNDSLSVRDQSTRSSLSNSVESAIVAAASVNPPAGAKADGVTPTVRVTLVASRDNE